MTMTKVIFFMKLNLKGLMNSKDDASPLVVDKEATDPTSESSYGDSMEMLDKVDVDDDKSL
jgi:hypothetical protein